MEENKTKLHLFSYKEHFASRKDRSDINKLVNGFNRISNEERKTIMTLLNAFLLSKSPNHKAG